MSQVRTLSSVGFLSISVYRRLRGVFHTQIRINVLCVSAFIGIVPLSPFVENSLNWKDYSKIYNNTNTITIGIIIIEQ